jgi:predicted membrane protein
MKKESVFWGMFFIIGAALLIVNGLGILDMGVGIGMIIISVIFLASLVKSILHRNVPGSLFSLAFLCIIYARPLGITMLSPWTVLGAALLGSIGISFIYHPKKQWHSSYFDDSFEEIETMKGNQLNMETSFGSSVKYINSEEFKTASLRCSFGAMKVYFDHAIVPDGEAVIYIDNSFGGVELYVPRNWKIVNQLNTSFGGVEEKGRYEHDGSVTLILTGKVSFAGLTIIYI